MNKTIRNMAIIMMVGFLIVTFYLTYLQVFIGDKIAAHQANSRLLEEESNIDRGRIISADNVILAENKQEQGTYRRYYPEGSIFSNVVGYYHYKYGKSGLELTCDDDLLGKETSFTKERLLSWLIESKKQGNSIILTIDSRMQEQCYELLTHSGFRGSIVVLEPKTGAVLAMVSSPSFDPNTLDENWETIRTDPSAPLLNRATQGKYPPGSSFKIVTSAAALDKNSLKSDETFRCNGQITIEGGKVSCPDYRAHGNVNFDEALTYSCNVTFAQIGLKVGGKNLVEEAEKFGFNKKIPFELPLEVSYIPQASEMDSLEVAWSAIGQGRVSVTPLEMAIITQTIANKGNFVKPYLVKEVQDSYGHKVREAAPEPTTVEVLKKDSAQTLAGMMIDVVEKGTGELAKIPGYEVAGKTGTAETSKDKPTHAWFVGFAPANDPDVAVAIILEYGQSGGEAAAPIAEKIMSKAILLRETQ